MYPTEGLTPTPSPSPPPPAKRGGTAIVILSILAVLFFLASGAMSGLYFVSKKSADKTIADQKQQIATLTEDAESQKAKLTRTEQDLTAANDKARAHEACLTAVQAFFKAVRDDNKAAGEAAVIDIVRNCEGVEIA